MTKPEHLTAITFDVGQTLLYPHPTVGTVMSEVISRYGHSVPAAVFDARMGVFDRYYTEQYERDESFWAEEERQHAMWIGGFTHVCRAVEIEGDLSEITHACYDEFDLASRWQLFEGVQETLAELKGRGYRLGVISNWGAGLEQLLDDIGIGHFFEVVTASAAAGVHKPMPEAFTRTLGALGVAPEHALHVGDHPTADIQGARAVGMDAVLVRLGGNDDPTAEGELPADVEVITALPQLLELVPEHVD